jgi:hypothetical protein
MIQLSRLVGQGILVGATAFSFAAQGVTGRNEESSDFRAIHQFALGEIERTQGSTVVVFDIDNTILKTPTNLGSEQWVVWQKSLLDQEPRPPQLVANSFQEILIRQDWILALTTMTPVHPLIPNAVGAYKNAGAKVIALTSRKPDTRDYTVRHLHDAGIVFSDLQSSNLPLAIGFVPYDLKRPEATGLSRKDLELAGGVAPRNTVFDRGVYLTDGQHKGLMLKSLLSRMGITPKSIIFVDDRAHHHVGMQKAFADSDIVVHSFRHTAMTPTIESFEGSDKVKEGIQWTRFINGVCAVSEIEFEEVCESL